MRHSFTERLKTDAPASLVVFLVAVPLCLGIALASGAPLAAGIIAGIVGGLVVGAASGSALGVSGPAAGLAVIVLTAIQSLGSWEAFLLAVVIAGVIQVALGFLRAGVIGYYFPSSVIKGMLAGIGLTIILKQLPHAVGYDADAEGSLAFSNTAGGDNTFSAIGHMFGLIEPGALLVAVLSLVVLVAWEQPVIKRLKASLWIQGPLVAVALGIVLNEVFTRLAPGLVIGASHLVRLPEATGLSGLVSWLSFPDFTQLGNTAIYTTALTLAVVASLETLLCVEATDRLDPEKRVTPTNRELKAQGLGNIISGLIGGLPITQVIVRSSANIQSGARSKLSAILHGVLLLVAVLAVPALLNRIPLATLAAILLTVGYKLAKPALFRSMYALGWQQFLPFIVTIVGILTTDLLVGIGLGLLVAVFQILLTNYSNPYFVDGTPHTPGAAWQLNLSEDVSFLNRAAIMRILDEIPPGSKVVLDATRSVNIDYDVYEVIKEYEQRAKVIGVDLTVKGLYGPRTRRNDPVRQVQRVLRREQRRLARSGASA
jgi:MFS superfamily sulfate permease-like transporter